MINFLILQKQGSFLLEVAVYHSVFYRKLRNINHNCLLYCKCKFSNDSSLKMNHVVTLQNQMDIYKTHCEMREL